MFPATMLRLLRAIGKTVGGLSDTQHQACAEDAIIKAVSTNAHKPHTLVVFLRDVSEAEGVVDQRFAAVAHLIDQMGKIMGALAAEDSPPRTYSGLALLEMQLTHTGGLLRQADANAVGEHWPKLAEAEGALGDEKETRALRQK